jgi:branched-chain amino acid transport system permease protein
MTTHDLRTALGGRRWPRWIVFLLVMVGCVGGLSLAGAAPASAQEGDEAKIRVFVQDQLVVDGVSTKQPVAGVAFEVLDAAGAQVGTGVTDETGRALVDLPSPGDYTVRIDESTLPEGKGIAANSSAERTVSVQPLQTFSVNFFTGEAKRSTTSTWEKVAQRTVDGTRLGLVIAITSVGLSLIFGTTGLTNFAHGEMVTFGGMVAFLLNVTIGLHLLIAGPVVVLLGGLFGYFLDWGLWGRLRRRGVGLIAQLVVSVGLSILLRYFFLYRFGGRTKPLRNYSLQQSWEWGPVSITPRDFTTAVLSLVVLVAVGLALQRTRMGKAVRAVSDNPDLASATGIDSQKVIRLVWFVGGALAALGGIVRGLDEQVGFEMGSGLLFLMFAGITLGGLGSAFGALVGGFLVGLFVEIAALVVPAELKNAPALAILVLVLLVRPQGILGRKERVG